MLPPKSAPLALLLAFTISPLAAEPARTSGNAKKESAEKHLLQYKFGQGDILKTKVIHQAAVRTTIEGTTQTAETVSISVKMWEVTDVNSEGHITFIHSVEYVDMKNDVTARESVHFDSRTGQEPPPGFEEVAKRVGIPLTKVVMDRAGNILKREDLAPGSTPASQLTMPLPKEPIAVGHVWTFPYEIRVGLRSGVSRKIQARQRMELQSIKNGIAEVHVVTQILTPVDDPEIETQLVQHESEGTVRFDIQAGRIAGQQIDLERRVTGYPNAKSSMHYRTRFTEKPIAARQETARKPGPRARN